MDTSKLKTTYLSVYMDHCLNCRIDRKLLYCCRNHPETWESVELELKDGMIVKACPNLNP